MKLVEVQKDKLNSLNGKTFHEAFEQFVWQNDEAQDAMRAAATDDPDFPKNVDKLIALWPNGRWPISLNIEHAVSSLAKSIPPQPPKFRRKKLSEGTGWLGSDIVANVRVRKGRAGRQEKPASTKAAYEILFSRFVSLIDLLHRDCIHAVGRSKAGYREKIARADWATARKKMRVSIFDNSLILRGQSGSETLYAAIELEVPKQASATTGQPGRKAKYPWREGVSCLAKKLENGLIVDTKAELARTLIDCLEELGCKELPDQKSAERYLHQKQNRLVEKALRNSQS